MVMPLLKVSTIERVCGLQEDEEFGFLSLNGKNQNTFLLVLI